MRCECNALYKRHEGNVSMSMQSYLSMRQKKASSALSTLAGFLISLLIVLSVSVTALAHEHVSLGADPPQSLARAGVSVVRLLVSYHDKAAAPGEMIECTGLGVLIASWPNEGQNDQNNWVLTDGSLVNSDTKATCAVTQPKAVLSSIQITMSSGYTPQLLNFPFLTSRQCNVVPNLVVMAWLCSHLIPIVCIHSHISIWQGPTPARWRK